MTDNQLEHELDHFITQQQRLLDTSNILAIHQLTHSASTSESLLIQLLSHLQEHTEFLSENTLNLHLNCLLVVHVNPDYMHMTRKTLTPQTS